MNQTLKSNPADTPVCTTLLMLYLMSLDISSFRGLLITASPTDNKIPCETFLLMIEKCEIGTLKTKQVKF